MYSKIDYVWMKNEAEKALSELPNHTFSSVSNHLSGSFVLPKDIKNKVNGMFKEINTNSSIKGSIVSLKENLNKLVKASLKIKKYQEKEVEILTCISNMPSSDDDDEEDEDDKYYKKNLKQFLKQLKSIDADSNLSQFIAKKTYIQGYVKNNISYDKSNYKYKRLNNELKALEKSIDNILSL